jgi:hypothetical protein
MQKPLPTVSSDQSPAGAQGDPEGSDFKEIGAVLEAVDQEVAFYRKRAGEVFFFGLLVEVLILAGREKISPPETGPLVNRPTYSILFIAVAAIGIALGSEYRRRIRLLKDNRARILSNLGFEFVYPSKQDQNLSEIQVLYVVLAFLSSGGIILVWLKLVIGEERPSRGFWVFILIGGVGLLYSALKVVQWLSNALMRQLRQWTTRLSHKAESEKTGGDINRAQKAKD